VACPVDREDVVAIIGGLFDANSNLAQIADDVKAIRRLLEEENGREEEEEEG
jgi:hypothetical protein